MIFECQYWRKELRRLAGDLRKRKDQRRWSGRSEARVEQQIMVGFYMVRKLIEANVLRDELQASSFGIKSFAFKAKNISYIIWPDVAEKYDLPKPKDESVNLKDVANQVIHSYVFTPSFRTNGGLTGVFVSSDDRRKDVRVVWLPVELIAHMFELTASSVSPGFRVAPERNRIRVLVVRQLGAPADRNRRTSVVGATRSNA